MYNMLNYIGFLFYYIIEFIFCILVIYMVKKFLLVFLFMLCMGMMVIIISLHLNNRTGYLCLGQPKIYTTIKHISNITLTTLDNKSSQYIWCVNHYGPNNQLKDFFKCCILAMINNYTLIIPPLFPHYGDQIRGIQWFDHFYDLNQLRLVLNLITLDQFIRPKIHKKKLMIDCYIRQIELVSGRTWYPLNTLISIQNYYKINIDFYHHINLSRQFNIKDLSNQSKNCSSMFLHIHYTTFGNFFSSSNIYTQSIFENLNRNPLIQRMTSELIKLLPELIINKNKSKNHLTTLAVIHMRLGDHTVMSVSMYIKQILYLINTGVRFTHLHIMCPYLTSSDIQLLTDSLPMAFTTTQHLIHHVRFVLDGYLFDVLEQEIACQAPIFLASPWTTYSATVLMQKVYQKKGIVYVLSAKDKTHPFLVTKKNAKYFK